MSKIKLVLGAFALLFSSISNATIWEYSISGDVDFYLDRENFTLDLTGTAYIDDVNLNIENPNCSASSSFVGCGILYNIPYFDMYVGGEYNNFTGTNAHILYSPTDFYGDFFGTGDWAHIRHSVICGKGNPGNPCTDLPVYEDWLAFELPDVITWEAGWSDPGEVIVNNPIFANIQYRFDATMKKVGPAPVPAPAAIWLFGTGLIGLIGFSKRKKSA